MHGQVQDVALVVHPIPPVGNRIWASGATAVLGLFGGDLSDPQNIDPWDSTRFSEGVIQIIPVISLGGRGMKMGKIYG